MTGGSSIPALRLATIGVGHLGRHHARILSALDGVTLSAVVDTIPDRAADIAASAGTRPLTDYRDLFGQVDAVTIAVPTELHREIAMPFLERGISVLVEKPMARSLAEADEMIAAARASGATLAVGHTERYNPAVTAVMPLVTSPRFIEVHRLGVFPERSLDIDVVFDLMIHDLDVILSLVRSEVASVEAVGVPVLTPRFDIANARLRFDVGLHRQRHREPHQQGPGAEDPVLSARRLHLDRLRRAGSRRLAPGEARRRQAVDPGWCPARSSVTSRCGSSWPTSRGQSAIACRRASTAPPAAAPSPWRR